MALASHTATMAATVIDGIPIVKWGLPAAATYTPADWCYWTAAITATHLDSATLICRLSKPCLVEFKPRVSSAMARKDADDTYGTSDKVPFILGGRKGYITTVAKITNPGADIYSGHLFMAGATAGDICLAAEAVTVGGTSSTAIRSFIINGFNPETVADTSTYMKFTWI